MATKTRRSTKYQRLLRAKKSLCNKRIDKAGFNKVAKVYIADAVKKGNKTKAQAQAVVNRVLKGACSK